MRILFCLVFISCNLIDEPHFEVDPLLKSSVNVFFQEAAKNNVNLTQQDLIVRWGNIGEVGLFEAGQINEVIISNDARSFDSLALQYVVFHELGHWMGRGHCKTFSIMNPNVYAADYHNSNSKRMELIKEMFQ